MSKTIRRDPKEKVIARVKKELEGIGDENFTGLLAITVSCRDGGFSKMNIMKEENVNISKGEAI